MPLLTCRELALGYDNSPVIEDVGFSVRSGDYLCIVGENGSGKSTLIKALLGLVPPVSGQIIKDEELRANEIGYLPQQTEVQKDFPASVREVVLSGCLGRCGLRPYYNRGEKKLAADNMERLGISHLSECCYRELSGGQQQRVLLSRALCATRKLLVLDEPVAGLDPKAATEMYHIIEALNREDKITIIMISHDVSAAIRYASHILHIGSRKPLFFGEKNDYVGTELGRAYVHADEGDM